MNPHAFLLVDGRAKLIALHDRAVQVTNLVVSTDPKHRNRFHVIKARDLPAGFDPARTRRPITRKTLNKLIQHVLT